MMREYIRQELLLFARGMLFGLALAILYDIIRVIRRVIVHNLVWITLEDFFYWFLCANMTFVFLYWTDNGNVRLCAVLASICGVILYQIVIGHFFVKNVSMGVIWICRILGKWKRRLTEPLLQGKIKLCKHFQIWKQGKIDHGTKKKKEKQKKTGFSNPTKE